MALRPDPLNRLFYGDNLEVLRQYIADESVDLVYLDPPFNSAQDYNVLFAEHDGTRAAAQIQAFEDTWRWDEAAERAYRETVESGGRIGLAMQALRTCLGASDMMAYLAMMAPRLMELRRVLKRTGSLYLHCDPTASHYLKVVLDGVFGPECFRSEIIWRRSSGHNKLTRQYGPVHDTILFYAKSEKAWFTPGTRPLMRGYVREWFTQEDELGPFRTNMLTGPGTRTGDSGRPWRGFDPTKVGRHWAIPGSLSEQLPQEASSWSTQQKLDALYDRGWVYIPRDGKGQPKYKQYVSAGTPYQDIWACQPYTAGTLYGTEESIDEDVKWLGHEQERLGYPTQKPEGLLERIIDSSSVVGDVVLDAFCGCGTTVAAAQKLGRRWIGVDITHLAINLIRHRLMSTYGSDIVESFTVTGEPVSLHDAVDLAATDPFQFQCWALGLVGARPAEVKKGADRGIDGRLFFHDEPQGGKTKTAVFSVKGGKLKAPDVRDLRGVLEREQATLAALISIDEPTRAMRAEAAAAGVYTSPWTQQAYPRLQLLTVGGLLSGTERFEGHVGRQINVTLKRAPRAAPPVRADQQPPLFEGAPQRVAKMAKASLPRPNRKHRRA